MTRRDGSALLLLLHQKWWTRSNNIVISFVESSLLKRTPSSYLTLTMAASIGRKSNSVSFALLNPSFGRSHSFHFILFFCCSFFSLLSVFVDEPRAAVELPLHGGVHKYNSRKRRGGMAVLKAFCENPKSCAFASADSSYTPIPQGFLWDFSLSLSLLFV